MSNPQGHRPSSLIRLSLRLLSVTSLITGALVVGAPTASAAPQCAYDTTNRSLAVTLSSTDRNLTISANGPYLQVGDVSCALLSEVNTVAINAAAAPTATVTFDLQNGPLGPGNFNEGNGSSEIEFSVDGLTAQSGLQVIATQDADKITLGWLLNRLTGYSAGQINLNGFVDGGTVDNDISFPDLPGRITIFAYGGDDVISGAGTGTVYTGPIYVPLMVHGAEGANQITGGGGDDQISFVEAEQPEGGDTLAGGGGVDTVRAYATGNIDFVRASISLDGLANDGSGCPGTTCNGDNVALDFERVEGSSASEIITGNNAAQHLSGNGGDDLVQGFGGNDFFTCAPGHYEGGAGSDTFQKEGGRHGSECGDLRGGRGNDTADFQYSQDPVVVTLDNRSNDGRVGGTTNVRTDIERVIGSAFNDSLTGKDKVDTLIGMAGDDALNGLGGADTLVPGPGFDTVGGGTGVDRLSYATSLVPVVIDAAGKGVTGEGNDTFTSIESYLGSPLADVMDGSGTPERFVGGAGNDDIFGAGANDVLLGGADDDTLNGGSGTDTCSQGAGTGQITNCEG